MCCSKIVKQCFQSTDDYIDDVLRFLLGRKCRCLLNPQDQLISTAPGFMDVNENHHAFVKEMTEKGKIAVAGPFPFSDPGELRGITVYRAGVEETAKIYRMIQSSKPDY